jgi:hypothetical protein
VAVPKSEENMKNWIFIVGLLPFFASCDPCGPPTGNWGKLIEDAKAKAGDSLQLEYIPCESYYFNVRLQGKVVDSSKIDEVHKILFDESKNIGWRVLQVYGPHGEHLFDHDYHGNFGGID